MTALFLEQGKHYTPNEGMCLMEAVAFIAGEKFTDHPKCVSQTLAAFGRTLNDSLMTEQRQRLIPLIPKLIGTVGFEEDERDSLRCAHWIVTHWLPAWLDLVPELASHAAVLRALPAPGSWSEAEVWGALVDATVRAARIARGEIWTPAPVATRVSILNTRKPAMSSIRTWDRSSTLPYMTLLTATVACEAAANLDRSLWAAAEQIRQSRRIRQSRSAWDMSITACEEMYNLCQPLAATARQLDLDSFDLFVELVEGRSR